MLFRLVVMCAMCVVCSILLCAAEVTAQDKERVNAILAQIDITQPATLDTTEEALVKEGEPLLAAMRAVLDMKNAELTAAMKDERKLGDVPNLNAQIEVLDRAIIRLSWKINPPELIQQWIKEHVAPAGRNLDAIRPLHIMDPRVAKELPAILFYLVRFRMYPVARSVPEPLSANNIFVVSKDGKVQLVTDMEGLKAIFQSNLPQVKDEKAAKEATYSWLRISQELSQDGMFQFSIPEETLTATKAGGKITASGKAVVKPIGGNSGEICATLIFEGGKLVDVQQTADLRAGMRPICQATKLLDPDPIVRKMAEQDLLIMGPAAEDYIIEQRAKASPELQQAIDAMWARIVARWISER